MPKSVYLILILISSALFLFGIYLPMLEIDMTAQINAQFINKDVNLLSQKHSIITTMETLWSNGSKSAATLILVFSILNPILKNIFLTISLFISNLKFKNQLLAILSFVSKWSFADVFVVAIFITFLSGGQNPESVTETISFLGMKVPVDIKTPITAKFASGFYYFTAFCFLSNILIFLYVRQQDRVESK